MRKHLLHFLSLFCILNTFALKPDFDLSHQWDYSSSQKKYDCYGHAMNAVFEAAYFRQYQKHIRFAPEFTTFAIEEPRREADFEKVDKKQNKQSPFFGTTKNLIEMFERVQEMGFLIKANPDIEAQYLKLEEQLKNQDSASKALAVYPELRRRFLQSLKFQAGVSSYLHRYLALPIVERDLNCRSEPLPWVDAKAYHLETLRRSNLFVKLLAQNFVVLVKSYNYKAYKVLSKEIPHTELLPINAEHGHALVLKRAKWDPLSQSYNFIFRDSAQRGKDSVLNESKLCSIDEAGIVLNSFETAPSLD